MKKRYIQFQDQGPRILINQKPDPKLGDAFEMSNEDFDELLNYPQDQWRVRIVGKEVKPFSIPWMRIALGAAAVGTALGTMYFLS